jgi:hypothetical protein
VSLKSRACNIGVYARRSLDDSGGINDRESIRQALKKLVGVSTNSREVKKYKFGLINHGCKNELGTPDTIVESAPMKLWFRGIQRRQFSRI